MHLRMMAAVSYGIKTTGSAVSRFFVRIFYNEFRKMR